jgi:hypothetical protein
MDDLLHTNFEVDHDSFWFTKMSNVSLDRIVTSFSRHDDGINAMSA